jgi:hypothetical protein
MCLQTLSAHLKCREQANSETYIWKECLYNKYELLTTTWNSSIQKLYIQRSKTKWGRSSLLILKEAYMIIKFITWQASAERDFYYDFYYNDVTKALDFQEHKNY